MTIPNLQLLDAFIESGEITQQETESVMAGAFKAVLVGSIVAGIAVAFSKLQAEIRRGKGP